MSPFRMRISDTLMMFTASCPALVNRSSGSDHVSPPSKERTAAMFAVA